MATENQKYIDLKQIEILELAKEKQKEFSKIVIDYIINSIAAGEDGILKATSNNKSKSLKLGLVLKKLEAAYGQELVLKLIDATNNLLNINSDYYKTIETNGKRFDYVKRLMRETMRSRLGINARGGLIRDGYLNNIANSINVADELKNILYRQVVLGRSNIKDVVKEISTKISGGKETNGLIENHIRTQVFDTFTQVDREINNQFANRLNLKYFIYQGGLIENSRDFCKKRNNKVFSVDETKEWSNDKDLPLTKAEKESGSPSGYHPLIDCGRWNCRHTIRYISNEMYEAMK